MRKLSYHSRSNEVWYPSPSCPDYAVSSFGRIRSLDKFVKMKCGVDTLFSYRFFKGRILTLGNNKDGYKTVGLSLNKMRTRPIPVHRLVYEACVGKLKPGFVINHKDFNRKNNRPQNLEQVTVKQNDHHSMRAGRKGKIDKKAIRDIRKTQSYKSLRKKYSIDDSCIWRIKAKEIYGWVK